MQKLMPRFVSLLPFIALAACTVGSDYAGPSSAGALPSGAHFARAAGVAADAEPGVAAWWKTLGDPVLDAIEEKALATNPDLAAGGARVNQARAALRQEKTNRLPSASADASYVHATLPGVNLGQSNQDSSGNSNISSLDFYNVGFDASWEVDVFGGRRRSVEAARASLGAAEANAADGQVSLTAEVAHAYINLRDRQHRIDLARDAAARQHEILKLVEQRLGAGTTTALDVEQQRNLTEQSDSALPPLMAERDAYLNALAVLAGEAPGALDAMLAAPAPVPLPPAEVAVGDPAALLQRRPDVRAAERQLAAATARIGVAEAARFPKVSFMGLIGVGGTDPGDIVDPDKFSALLLPRISWNFLDFGRNAARVGQAKGVREEAEARYRSAVLSALRDAEDALSRYGAQRAVAASVARSKASADRAAVLVGQRFAAGTTTRVDVLNAERQRLSADQSLSQAITAMTADYVAIQKALGLGWR